VARGQRRIPSPLSPTPKYKLKESLGRSFPTSTADGDGFVAGCFGCGARMARAVGSVRGCLCPCRSFPFFIFPPPSSPQTTHPGSPWQWSWTRSHGLGLDNKRLRCRSSTFLESLSQWIWRRLLRPPCRLPQQTRRWPELWCADGARSGECQGVPAPMSFFPLLYLPLPPLSHKQHTTGPRGDSVGVGREGCARCEMARAHVKVAHEVVIDDGRGARRVFGP
jgi:hypothetical protein